MSEAAQSQAIMFESTGGDELRAGRVEPAPGLPPVVDEKSVSKRAVDTTSVPVREQITFERGYEELKAIVSRLDDPELPVHEMFEGFRRGKGLEKALRAYLQEREGELAELEEGNNLPEFEIASPSSGPAAK
jgi:exodeoxyribonuclease VII small subunit